MPLLVDWQRAYPTDPSLPKWVKSISEKLNSSELWRLVKPLVRELEDEGGVLIIDETMEEKPHTDESELVCWHYDHSKGRNVKGINLSSTLYWVRAVSIPVDFELVKKTEWIFNEKKKRWQRKSPQTKNELYRRMLKTCVKNRIEFRCVLNDVWYAPSENMRCIKEELKKESIMTLRGCADRLATFRA